MKLPDSALGVMRIAWVVAAAVIFAILLGIDLGLRLAADVSIPLPPALAAFIVGALVLAGGLWWSGMVFRSWHIELDDERLRVDHGVLMRRSAFVPRTRVQHVSTEQGPIQRARGLTSLTVHTAGARTPNVDIVHLELDDAEQLRRELLGDD